MSIVAKRRKSFVKVVVFRIFISRHALNVKKTPRVDNFRDNSINNIDSSTLAKTNECEAVVNPIRFWPQLVQERQTSVNPGQRKRCFRNENRIRTFWQATKTIEAIRHKSYDKRPYAEVRLLGQWVLGLLDTGAAISAIGGKLAEQVIRNRIRFKKVLGSLVLQMVGSRTCLAV